MNASGCDVDKNKLGRPMSERMTEALKRVAAGERVLHVAHAMGFRNSQQLYNAIRRRKKQDQS